MISNHYISNMVKSQPWYSQTQLWCDSLSWGWTLYRVYMVRSQCSHPSSRVTSTISNQFPSTAYLGKPSQISILSTQWLLSIIPDNKIVEGEIFHHYNDIVVRWCDDAMMRCPCPCPCPCPCRKEWCWYPSTDQGINAIDETRSNIQARIICLL